MKARCQLRSVVANLTEIDSESSRPRLDLQNLWTIIGIAAIWCNPIPWEVNVDVRAFAKCTTTFITCHGCHTLGVAKQITAIWTDNCVCLVGIVTLISISVLWNPSAEASGEKQGAGFPRQLNLHENIFFLTSFRLVPCDEAGNQYSSENCTV